MHFCFGCVAISQSQRGYYCLYPRPDLTPARFPLTWLVLLTQHLVIRGGGWLEAVMTSRNSLVLSARCRADRKFLPVCFRGWVLGSTTLARRIASDST